MSLPDISLMYVRHDSHVYQSINQSINQPSFYNANIPGVARLSGETAKSVLNSKSMKQFHNKFNKSLGICMPVSVGKRPGQKVCLETFPEGGN